MACCTFTCLQNCLNISDIKFMPASEITFLGGPNSANTIFAALTRSWAARLLPFFTTGKFAVVIYNVQKSFIFNKKDISTNHLPQFAWHFTWDCLLMWCLLIWQACGTPLYSIFFMSTFIFTNTPTPLLIVSFFQCPHGCCVATTPVFISAKENVLLFFWSSWQCHHCHLISNWPVVLDVVFPFIFYVWPALLYVCF